MYQVASASHGAHTLAVRNAGVPEVVFSSSMAPGHEGSPKNLAELTFAVRLHCAVGLCYFRAFENLAENLAVPCPINYHTLTSCISSSVFETAQGVQKLNKTQLSSKTSSATLWEHCCQDLDEDKIRTRLAVRVMGHILRQLAMLMFKSLC